MFDLESRNKKVSQIQHKKNRQKSISFPTSGVLTFRNETFREAIRRNIKIHKEIYHHQQKYMKDVLYYQQKIQKTHVSYILRRVVLYVLRKRKVQQEVL